MSFADLPEVRLHYRFDGEADAPPLVLSNSLGTISRCGAQMRAVRALSRAALRHARPRQSSVPPGRTRSRSRRDVWHCSIASASTGSLRGVSMAA